MAAHPRRRYAISRTLALIIVLGTALVTSGSTKTPAPQPLYAYMTANELVIMHGGQISMTVPVSTSDRAYRMTWTLDGQHVVVIEDAADRSARMLIVADVFAGKIRRLPCPFCTSAMSVGGALLLVAQQDPFGADDSFASMLRFDLSKAELPLQLAPKLELSHVYFLAGLPGEGVITGYDEAKNLSVYLLIRPDGSVATAVTRPPTLDDPIIDQGSLFSVGDAAIAHTREGALVIAATTRYKRPDPACGGDAHVFITSPTTGETLDTDLSAVTPGGHTAGVDAVVTTGDLWWGQDGLLHAILAAWSCDNPNDPKTSPTEWRLKDGKWLQVSSEHLVGHRDLGAGVDAILEDDGILTLNLGIGREKVADHVLGFSAPPVNVGAVAATVKNSQGSCLLDAGRDLGSRTGDIDGDGIPDKVSLTVCASHTDNLNDRKVVAHVDFGNGKSIDQVVTTSAQSEAASWVGLTDVTGNKHDEIFMVDSSGAHTLHVVIFEYRDGILLPLRGDLPKDGLILDDSLTSDSGFSCDTTGGHIRFTAWEAGLDSSASPPVYGGDETVYQPDEQGVMRRIDHHSVTYAAIPDNHGYYEPPPEINARAGAHCPGLDVFPSP